jgi:nitrite reductase/ring-hydroxylating ferredoxin subunit
MGHQMLETAEEGRAEQEPAGGLDGRVLQEGVEDRGHGNRLAETVRDTAPAAVKPALARVFALDLPPPGQAKLVELSGDGASVVPVILVRQADGGLRAFLNRCPHARWPLDTFDGRFLFSQDGALVCAAHGAAFDPASGACLGGPGTGAGLTPVAASIDACGAWTLSWPGPTG